MSDEFRGKVALVTGGGSGIGRATALAFAAQGVRVVVSDAAGTGAESVAGEVRGRGGEALALRADVSRSGEVQEMVRAALERFGRVDFSVHNAGIGGEDARTADASEEVWRRVLDVNLTGVFLCMKHVIPPMVEAGGGVIVNVASVSGLIGYPRHAAYCASKHGVVGLTRAAALEYGRRGVRINCVCPGFTRTPMVEEGLIRGEAEAEKQLTARMPLGRLGTPEEIAASVLYLCSDAAAFMIGHALVLDGGIAAA